MTNSTNLKHREHKEQHSCGLDWKVVSTTGDCSTGLLDHIWKMRRKERSRCQAGGLTTTAGPFWGDGNSNEMKQNHAPIENVSLISVDTKTEVSGYNGFSLKMLGTINSGFVSVTSFGSSRECPSWQERFQFSSRRTFEEKPHKESAYKRGNVFYDSTCCAHQSRVLESLLYPRRLSQLVEGAYPMFSTFLLRVSRSPTD